MGKILEGDCLEVMRGMEENSIHAIICDPPYALGFMGKAWDRFPTDKGPKKPFANQSREAKLGGHPFQKWCQSWATECLRVAKPGAYLLAFGGTRTFHRLACAIEDAGWILKDTLSWNYGSGFPKSHDVSKAIDKVTKRLNLFEPFARHFKQQREKKRLTHRQIAQHFPSRTGGMTGCVWNWENAANVPTRKQWKILQPMLDLSLDFLPLIERIEAEREVVGKKKAGMGSGKTFGMLQSEGENANAPSEVNVTAPATPEAKQWDGFGTALKPAWEPIILAQAPLEGTYAENVLKWGCGALNIDACRISGSKPNREDRGKESHSVFGNRSRHPAGNSNEGRWPANFLLSHTMFCEKVGEKRVRQCNKSRRLKAPGSFGLGGDGGHNVTYGDSDGLETVEAWNCVPDCPVRMLDEQSKAMGIHGAGSKTNGKVYEGCYPFSDAPRTLRAMRHGDQGGASRFFYCAKASRRERNAGLNAEHNLFMQREEKKSDHPTVKPIALMRYLCRLVTPPGGTVCDPFVGSGSTGCAAALEGFEFIGIEKERGYAEIARARIAHFSQGSP